MNKNEKGALGALIKLQGFKSYLIYTAIILFTVGIDQLTKYLAAKYLTKVATVPIIEGVLHLTYLENRGAAFGMLANHRWVFMVISSLTIVGLGLYLYLFGAPGKLYGVSIAMIIGGGIGNMIDRTAFGYVVDFIDFRLIDFAIFNGADSFVCVGAGLLVLAMLLDIRREAKEKREGKGNGGDTP